MGDTHEFNVYPKDSSGSAFPLAQYTDVDFVIAPKRGDLSESDPTPIAGYAVFATDRTHIACAITPANAEELNVDQSYVFDVKISKSGTPYDSTHTLLTGNITIQNRVNPIPEESIAVPVAPTSITVAGVTEDSISLAWSAPETGGAPDGYYLYVTPYSIAYEDSETLQSLVSAMALATPVDTSELSATLTSTTAIPALGISSVALEPGTAYVYAIASYNTAGTSDPSGNFDVSAGTVEEVFTDGGS